MLCNEISVSVGYLYEDFIREVPTLKGEVNIEILKYR